MSGIHRPSFNENTVHLFLRCSSNNTPHERTEFPQSTKEDREITAV
jgi:hypothetical protein